MDADNGDRDMQIVADYESGLSAARVARKHGLSVSHVRSILSSKGACKNKAMPRPQAAKVIDPVHLKLGNRIYGFRFRKANDVQQAADFLGWSVKKLRSVETGITVLTLEDLQDVARYLQISLSELLKDL